MKLSVLLKENDVAGKYSIFNDCEFDTLALAKSEIGLNYCTFIDNVDYIESLSENATMIFTNQECAEKLLNRGKGVCVVENPRVAFFKLHNKLARLPWYRREKFETKIGKNCKIDKLCSIASENVIIGDNVTIEEFVVIRENTVIGDNVTIRAGAKIGGTDFEFKRDEGKIFGVEHCGGVIIGNEVEIQYNTGINRALYPWDNTEVGDFTKVDMLVHIAHGVKIGKACMIVANSGIGGRTTIGDGCWVGFGSTVRNGIKIGDNARINMGSVVTKDVEAGEAVTGNFAIRHEDFIKKIKKENI